MFEGLWWNVWEMWKELGDQIGQSYIIVKFGIKRGHILNLWMRHGLVKIQRAILGTEFVLNGKEIDHGISWNQSNGP